MKHTEAGAARHGRVHARIWKSMCVCECGFAVEGIMTQFAVPCLESISNSSVLFFAMVNAVWPSCMHRCEDISACADVITLETVLRLACYCWHCNMQSLQPPKVTLNSSTATTVSKIPAFRSCVPCHPSPRRCLVLKIFLGPILNQKICNFLTVMLDCIHKCCTTGLCT